MEDSRVSYSILAYQLLQSKFVYVVLTTCSGVNRYRCSVASILLLSQTVNVQSCKADRSWAYFIIVWYVAFAHILSLGFMHNVQSYVVFGLPFFLIVIEPATVVPEAATPTGRLCLFHLVSYELIALI